MDRVIAVQRDAITAASRLGQIDRTGQIVVARTRRRYGRQVKRNHARRCVDQVEVSGSRIDRQCTARNVDVRGTTVAVRPTGVAVQNGQSVGTTRNGRLDQAGHGNVVHAAGQIDPVLIARVVNEQRRVVAANRVAARRCRNRVGAVVGVDLAGAVAGNHRSATATDVDRIVAQAGYDQLGGTARVDRVIATTVEYHFVGNTRGVHEVLSGRVSGVDRVGIEPGHSRLVRTSQKVCRHPAVACLKRFDRIQHGLQIGAKDRRSYSVRATDCYLRHNSCSTQNCLPADIPVRSYWSTLVVFALAAR